MGILPVSLSMMATLLSAVMVLGVPAEVYYNGTIYWIILFSNIIVYPLAAHAFLPVYHNLGLTSAYEVMICFLFRAKKQTHFTKYDRYPLAKMKLLVKNTRVMLKSGVKFAPIEACFGRGHEVMIPFPWRNTLIL